jgi:hypothetical protein
MQKLIVFLGSVFLFGAGFAPMEPAACRRGVNSPADESLQRRSAVRVPIADDIDAELCAAFVPVTPVPPPTPTSVTPVLRHNTVTPAAFDNKPVGANTAILRKLVGSPAFAIDEYDPVRHSLAGVPGAVDVLELEDDEDVVMSRIDDTLRRKNITCKFDCDGMTPLHHAARKLDFEAVRNLCASHPHTIALQTKHEGKTALHLAVEAEAEDAISKSNKKAIIEFLLLNFPVLLTIQDVCGNSPLCMRSPSVFGLAQSRMVKK